MGSMRDYLAEVNANPVPRDFFVELVGVAVERFRAPVGLFRRMPSVV
jgi:hypothetical protein